MKPGWLSFEEWQERLRLRKAMKRLTETTIILTYSYKRFEQSMIDAGAAIDRLATWLKEQ